MQCFLKEVIKQLWRSSPGAELPLQTESMEHHENLEIAFLQLFSYSWIGADFMFACKPRHEMCERLFSALNHKQL